MFSSSWDLSQKITRQDLKRLRAYKLISRTFSKKMKENSNPPDLKCSISILWFHSWPPLMVERKVQSPIWGDWKTIQKRVLEAPIFPLLHFLLTHKGLASISVMHQTARVSIWTETHQLIEASFPRYTCNMCIRENETRKRSQKIEQEAPSVHQTNSFRISNATRWPTT